jgi:tRNA threonylcarbamoyladenosine biosynthesis protein TsaB
VRKKNEMPYLLHLETATTVCSVALSKNGKLVQLVELADDSYVHGEQLTMLIQQVMTSEGIQASDLNGVGVSSGPGSYTGLRIGIATAKGLCYALNIPLLTCTTLESMAVLARQKHPEIARFCPMIDARRMEVFAGIFQNNLELLKPMSADVLDETSYSEYEPFLCFGDGASKMKDLWKERNLIFDLEIRPSAVGQIETVTAKYHAGIFEDVAYFEPFYMKEFYMPSKSSEAKLK